MMFHVPKLFGNVDNRDWRVFEAENTDGGNYTSIYEYILDSKMHLYSLSDG